MGLDVPGLLDIVYQLEPFSLASESTTTGGAIGPIPKNQWQLDVEHWWATFLSS